MAFQIVDVRSVQVGVRFRHVIQMQTHLPEVPEDAENQQTNLSWSVVGRTQGSIADCKQQPRSNSHEDEEGQAPCYMCSRPCLQTHTFRAMQERFRET